MKDTAQTAPEQPDTLPFAAPHPENGKGPPTERSRLAAVDLSRRISSEEEAELVSRAQRRLLHLRLVNGGHSATGSWGPPVCVVFEGWDASGKGGAIRAWSPRSTPATSGWPSSVPPPRRAPPPLPLALLALAPGLGGHGHLRPLLVRTGAGRTGREAGDRGAVAAGLRRDRRLRESLAEEGMVMIKLWLHISHEEQLQRFEARRDDPLKRWKLTDEDWRNREKRADYEAAVEDMLAETDHPFAPWDVIPAEQKRYGRVAVLRTVITRMEEGMRREGSNRRLRRAPTTAERPAPRHRGRRAPECNSGRRDDVPPPRHGITIPFDGVPLSEHRPWFERLAELGYTDVWSAEVDGADGFTPLALAAAWGPTLRLGVAIAPAFTRGPAVLAQSVAALAEAAPGRFALGSGASSEVIVAALERHPASSSPTEGARRAADSCGRPSPARRWTATCSTLRASSGFRLARPPATPPPILLAALRPGMLALAGREADGAIINWLRPDDVATVAAEIGPGKEIVARIFVIPNARRRAGPGVGRRMIAAYLNVPVYAEFHRWLGPGPLLEDMWEAWASGDRKGALAAVPDEVVDDLMVHGGARGLPGPDRAATSPTGSPCPPRW